MYPELFHIGPIPIHGFGLMLAIAFLSANYLFTRFTREQKIHDDIPSTITLIALVAGIVGSKLFSIVEEYSNKKINKLCKDLENTIVSLSLPQFIKVP